MGDTQDGWFKLDEPTDGFQVRQPGDGEIPTPSGDWVNILIDGSDSRGLVAFLEYRLAPHAEGPPTHWHSAFDELFYVVSGSMGMRSGDNTVELGPRGFAFVPRGVPHTFWNTADEECVFVSGWTPAGAEQAWILGYHLSQEFATKDYSKIPPERIEELMRVADSIMFETV